MFNVGDIVECVCSLGYAAVKMGGIYKVVDVNSDGRIMLEHNTEHYYIPDDFELVQKCYPFKTYKRPLP